MQPVAARAALQPASLCPRPMPFPSRVISTLDRWGFMLPFVVFVAHAVAFGSYLIDDAGITFAYARSFADGAGLVSQPGMDPVEGYSNTLWLLLLAPFMAFDAFDVVWTPKLLGGAFALATFSLIWRLLRRHDAPISVRLGALTLLALNTPYVLWSVAGLENALYGWLVVVLVSLCGALWTDAATSRRVAYGAGVAATALVMTRPDGLLFLGLFPACAVLSARWRADAPWRATVARHAAVAGGLTGGFFAFRWLYFHDVLPNTAYAKGVTAGAASLPWPDAATLGLATAAGALMGGVVWYHRARPERTEVRAAAWMVLAVLSFATWKLAEFSAAASAVSRMVGSGAGLVLLAVIFGDVTRRVMQGRWDTAAVALYMGMGASLAIYAILPVDWMPEYRFGIPAIVMLHLILGVACAPLARRGGPAATLAVLALVVAVQGLHFAERTQTVVEMQVVPFAEVEAANGHALNRVAVALGLEGHTLLVPDLGGTLWASSLHVVDLAGLCDRTIARSLLDDPERMHQYIFDDVRPEFIVTHPMWSDIVPFARSGRFGEAYARVEVVDGVVRPADEPFAHAMGVYVRRDALANAYAAGLGTLPPPDGTTETVRLRAGWVPSDYRPLSVDLASGSNSVQ